MSKKNVLKTNKYLKRMPKHSLLLGLFLNTPIYNVFANEVSDYSSFKNAINSNIIDEIIINSSITKTETNSLTPKITKEISSSSDNYIFDGNGGKGFVINNSAITFAVHNMIMENFNSDNGSVINIKNGNTANLTNTALVNNQSTAKGGAIYNYAIVNIKDGLLSGNYTKGNGGAIFNESAGDTNTSYLYVSGVTKFSNNGWYIDDSGNDIVLTGDGGAIFNAQHAHVKTNSTTTFEANKSIYNGGAIFLQGYVDGDDNTLYGNFKSNVAGLQGGAIYVNSHMQEAIDIEATFSSNKANNAGGAIKNLATISKIKNSKFSDNSVNLYGGGAIDNTGEIKEIISTTFDANHSGTNAQWASGGAINNSGTIGVIINSIFTNNVAQVFGGAIYTTKDLSIKADGSVADSDGNVEFSGNYVSTDGGATKKYEAIYVNGASLNLSAVNNGTMTFNDGINGNNYNLNIAGDSTGNIVFNNLVENVNHLTLSDKSILHLGINGKIQAKDMKVSDGSMISTMSSNSPLITVDVKVDRANNKVDTGKIEVSGDVEGNYNVLVNALNPDVLDNKEDAVVPFLFAPNDVENTTSSFSVARVIGSPYLWDGKINAKGETDGSIWYLNLTDEVNPNYDPTPDPDPDPTPVNKVVAPEVIAGIGLHEAAIEQTRSLVYNVSTKVAEEREHCPGCGLYSNAWNGKTLRNGWVLAQGENANIDKPVDMEAKIWGVEGGFDIQSDVNNTLGVFASYRKGEYDLNGKGSKYRSSIGSDIDIDSYIGGLYYRYDKNFSWLFATLYGGIQNAEVKTDDGIAKFESEGLEFGGSVEVGHSYGLMSDLSLDPSLGIYYTQVNFDSANDNVGKHYSWDKIKHVEAQVGAKLTKNFENANVYVKPSVIQTLSNDDRVSITGMKGNINTYHDQTLGRLEIGGRYGFSDSLSAYGWANYTFGSSYDAASAGAGVNYAW